MRLTVDPGISGTGWALWNDQWGFVKADNIFARKRDNWVDAALEIEYELKKVIAKNHVTWGAIEFPKYFDSVGGNMIAKRGDLLKLTFLVGMLYSSFEECQIVPVNTWKGNLQKEVVIGRIGNRLSQETCMKLDKHMWDAVGIGLFLKGEL